MPILKILCFFLFTWVGVVQAQMECSILQNIPGKSIRHLYVGLIPAWVEAPALGLSDNLTIGLGGMAFARFTPHFMAQATYKTTYQKTLVDGAGVFQNQTFAPQYAQTARFQYFEAQFMHTIWHQWVGDKKFSVKVKDWYNPFNYYLHMRGVKQNTLMGRMSVYYQRYGVALSADSLFSDSGTRMDRTWSLSRGGAYNCILDQLGVTMGLSFNRIWDMLVYIKGYGTRMRSVHRCFYADAMYSPSIKINAVQADGTTQPLITSTGSAIALNPWGFRAGYCELPSGKWDVTWGIEGGMRPSVALKDNPRPFFLSMWLTVPIYGFNLR